MNDRLRTGDVARLLRLSGRAVRRLVEERGLPMSGGWGHCRQADLRKWIDRNSSDARRRREREVDRAIRGLPVDR